MFTAEWKKWAEYDPKIKKDLEIHALKRDNNLKSNNISFNTSGVRGILGAGLDKINIVTISLVARAYAKFLIKNKKNAKKMGVVIANDNRWNSNLFNKTVIEIFETYGIKTYVMPDERLLPSPVLSFLIKDLKAAGGINITASHNSSKYNGLKIYDEFGCQLTHNDTKEISKIMDEIDPFLDERGKYKPKYIDEKRIDKYIDEICKLKFTKNNDIKVVYSPVHGSGKEIGEKLLKKMGVNSFVVKSQKFNDSNFGKVRSANPEKYKSYNDGIKLARKTKSDIIVITDSDGGRTGAVVKYKRRYKYLNGNEIASIYLEYYLRKLKKAGKLPKDGYIVKSVVSTDMAKKIASKYGVKTLEANVGFENISETIKNSEGTFLFGFEESYGFLINNEISGDKDAFQGIVSIVDMAIYYKGKGITLFDQLRKLQNQYRIHRNIQKSSKVDKAGVNRIFKGLIRTKSIYGNKVQEVIDFRKDKKNPQQMVKVILKNGSWIVVRPSGTESKTKYYVQTIAAKHENLMNAVVAEKKMFEYIDELAEFFPSKKFSWKTVAKYVIFVLIMIGLLALVFKGIYGSYSSSSESATSAALDWYDTKAKYIFLVGIAGIFFNIFVDAWMKYRLLKFHKQNVKVRHLFISSIMGSIVSYLTPLAIGGDGIGYWYLRRKGFKRAPLAATFLTSTILWQMKNIVLTAILLPMGLHMFEDILTNGTPEAKSVMVIFIIGISWSIFSMIMLWTILISKKFQEWSISTSIKLLEWLPWVHISDPGSKASGYMAKFANFRSGMKKIWRSPKILGEALFYETIPKLFSIGAFINIWLGVVRDDLEYGKYWSQIVATDVVNTANSFSLTPGSTGFIEFISLHIRDNIFVPDSITGYSKDTVINLDIVGKFISQWPYLILSSITAIMVIIGESRRKVYRTTKRDAKRDTTFYKKTAIIWPLYAAGWLAWIFLI